MNLPTSLSKVITLVAAADCVLRITHPGLPGVIGGFRQMGIPLPGIVGPGVAILELVGGILILFGLFTRIIAILLAIDMLGAIFFVHLKNGFFLPMGFEFAFTMLMSSLALVVGGPGAYAIESRFMGQGV